MPNVAMDKALIFAWLVPLQDHFTQIFIDTFSQEFCQWDGVDGIASAWPGLQGAALSWTSKLHSGLAVFLCCSVHDKLEVFLLTEVTMVVLPRKQFLAQKKSSSYWQHGTQESFDQTSRSHHKISRVDV
jgi:hypothetical protein